MALSPYDQSVYDAGFKFIPQTQYLQNPFQIPEDEVTADPNTGAGITTLPLDRGDSNRLSYEQVTPRFDDRGFASAKEYGPGGRYEVNPTALGFEFGSQGQVMRAGPMDYMQGQLAPSTLGERQFGSSLDQEGIGGLSLREIADMYDERLQMQPGQDFRNFMKNFTGAKSNFEVARVPGMIEQMAGKIPSITGILASLGNRGDRSDTSRFAVDNVGFGATGMRDQFGVFTGGKSLFGKTKDYSERMRNEISEIAKNFGYDEDDLMNLDPATLSALGARNSFRKNQVIDYVNKLQAKDIEAKAKARIELERERRKTREADRKAGAFTDKVQQDKGGGGSWREQTAAKERQGVSVAGPGFGKGAYFADGGIVDMLEIYD